MTNPILERAARALCELDGADWSDPIIDQTGVIVGSIREEYYAQARAVLMAVREPEPMKGQAAAGQWAWLKAMGYTSKAYTAMIDAILNDGEKPPLTD